MASTSRMIIIGGGPAGLASALALARAGRAAIVVEKDEEVGGLCRTISHDGFLFDIGGHRFLSASAEVNRLWREVLDGDLLHIKRQSRIYYRSKFIKYPLSFPDILKNLGLGESVRQVFSFAWATLFRPGEEKSFEGWGVNRFGRRLFDTFFNGYTQKLWGLPCRLLSSDWAAQRIRGLSFSAAVREAIFGAQKRGPKTLSSEFLYPRRGPGQFYGKLKEQCERAGVAFLLKTRATGFLHDGRRIVSVEVDRGGREGLSLLPAAGVLSSMPLPSLVRGIRPAPPAEVLSAAAGLRFRNFLSVNVIIKGARLFPDQWIYINSPRVKVSRIQNFKNWSPDMAGSPDKTPLALEYFCSEDDDLWRAGEAELVDLAAGELEAIGLVPRSSIEAGFVVRRENAYPIYDLGYRPRLEVLKAYLCRFDNFQAIGRGGLFRYDNSDLALLTGLRAAENLTANRATDLWAYDIAA